MAVPDDNRDRGPVPSGSVPSGSVLSGPALSATGVARVLLRALVAQGVRWIVLAPGSRSAPLAYAAVEVAARSVSDGADSPQHPELLVRIDERSAAFTALGLAKASGAPVAVITTSGTAAANLHPAVVEAHHAGVPLIAVTADRPPALRNVGANQTIEQPDLFGRACRMAADLVLGVDTADGQQRLLRDIAVRAVAAATGALSGDPGPVHLNVPLSEPLVPDGDESVPDTVGAARTVIPRTTAPLPYELPAHDATVVIAGDGATGAARELAEAGGWPLFAEPSSDALGGACAIPGYRLLLDTPLAVRIRRAVVFGRPTLSRPVTRLLARADVEVVVVTDRPDWPDAARRAAVIAPAVTTAPSTATGSWLAAWRAAGDRAAAAITEIVDSADRPTGLAVAADLLAAAPAGALLVLGSSNPVRDVDLMLPANGVAAGVRVVANRGVAGIDGTVSTAVGAALASTGGAYALLGDLTFLHDVNGLLLGPDERRPDLTIVVVNDDGGGIFELLEPGDPRRPGADRGAFERVFATPHGADVGALCAGYGVRHVIAKTRADVRRELAAPPAGICVVEVPCERAGLRDLHARITAGVAAAVAAVAGSAS